MKISEFTEYLKSKGFKFKEWQDYNDISVVVFVSEDDNFKVNIRVYKKDSANPSKGFTYKVNAFKRKDKYEFQNVTPDISLDKLSFNDDGEILVPQIIKANFLDNTERYELELWEYDYGREDEED